MRRQAGERLLGVLHDLGAGRAAGPALLRPIRWGGWAGFLTLLVWTSPAARGHRGRAVGRLWAWELWRRAVGRPVEVHLPGGGRLRLPCWSTLAGPTVATGLHEPAEQLFVSAYLRPDDAVVDVGANLGAYAVPCAARGALVVAVEPSSRARAALADNIRLNHLEPRVRVYGVAAGRQPATAALTTGLDAANHLLDAADASTASEVVDVRPLDALLDDAGAWLGGRRIALLKVDVEGGDLDVLRGARRLLAHHRPVVVVESWAGGHEIRALLAGGGYRVHRFDVRAGALVEYPGDWSGHCNFIAVPDERTDDVRHRLGASPPAPGAAHRVRWRAGPPPPAERALHVAGIVPPGPSGVADYGRLLSEALARRGFAVHDGWVTADGRSWRAALVAATRFLRSGLAPPPGSVVLWHYSSFAYGLRGVPLHGVLFGMVARARRCCIVTILHEPAYPRGRRGWRGAVQAATQGLALRPVLLASSALVVTTERRAEDARRVRRPFRRAVHTLPVFSTLGVPDPDPAPAAPPAAGRPTVGVLKYTGDGTRADVVVGALSRLPADRRPRLVLLGAPGPAAPEVRAWTDAAEAAGLSPLLEFSGVLERSELSRRLRACDVLVIPNDEGPSGRHTSVAAALAHAVPTLALDGPDRWPDLVDEGALVVVPADPGALAAELADLLGAPGRRADLAARGRDFHDRRLTLEGTADAVAGILAEALRSRGSSRRGTGPPSPSVDG